MGSKKEWVKERSRNWVREGEMEGRWESAGRREEVTEAGSGSTYR